MSRIHGDGVIPGGRKHSAARLAALGMAGLLAFAMLPGIGLAADALTLDKPLTADDVASLALERSYTVLSQREEVSVANGAYRVARSSLIPNVSLGARYSNTIETTVIRLPAVPFPIPESQFWTGFGNVSQSLVNFSTWNSVKSAELSQQATVDRYSATRADIALDAYRQFYALLKAQKLAAVSQENLVLTQDQLKRTEALFELGSVAKGDVLKQKVSVSQAQQELIRDRRAILIERARLANLLGLDPSKEIPIDTTLTEPLLVADSTAVYADALNNRPELAEARSLVQSADASVASAQGLRYPSIDGNLNYSFTTPGWPESFNQVKAIDNWNLNFTLNIPIFDGLNAKGQIRQAEARKLQAQYALRNQELLIAVEVEEALQAVSLSRERLEVARDGLAAAEEDLKLSQEKYNVGSATVLELIDAQVSRARSQSEFVSALADAHIAVIQLRRVRGEPF